MAHKWVARAGMLAVALGAASVQAGDVEYGAYLAHDCTSCHRQSGASGAIPSLVGLPAERLAQAMRDFRSGARDNPTMRTVARSLGDEEIEALAAYFATQLADGTKKIEEETP
jgi:cytochrome c553